MNKIKKRFSDLFLRYTLILLVGLFAFSFIYKVFLPLTLYPVYFIINIFYESFLNHTLIFIGRNFIEIADACVAGSAYFLLFALNMAVPNLKIQKRIYMILSSFAIFLAINIIRIVILSFLFFEEFSFFNTVHLLFWYLFSIIFVVGIWFFEIKIFKVKEVPFYSDLKFIYENSSLKKNRRRKKK